MTTLSMDGTDPGTWDPALDGVLAAPENHKVLYEDEAISTRDHFTRPGSNSRKDSRQDLSQAPN
jgi:hypothetical protein